MQEPHRDLPWEAIVAAVRASYGIRTADLAFRRSGDSYASAYRLTADDGGVHFLKVRAGAVYEPGLVVPSQVRECGVPNVLAPVRTTGCDLWTALGAYSLVLYPHIEGRTGMEQGLTDRQWTELGALVRRLHAVPLTPRLRALVPAETFTPRWGGAYRPWDVVRRLNAQIAGATFTDLVLREAAARWRRRSGEIDDIVDRAERLGGSLSEERLPSVLCHADMHTNNVLVDEDGALWLIDWDEVALAPKERDLMFALGGGINRNWVNGSNEALFRAGYGESDISALALAYYRHAWAVQDIADFGEQTFTRADLAAPSRHAGAEALERLFSPGQIVDLAQEALSALPSDV